MILVIGSFTAAIRHVDQALSLSRQHVARSREEPGCVSHDVHVDADNARRLVFIEQWSDAAALQVHFKVPATRKFVRSIAELATSPPSVKIYDSSPIDF